MAIFRPHAALGASSAHRWMSCSGSVRLAAGIEARASTYAEEGAAAHMLAEICLDEKIDALALIGRELNGHAVDAEMTDGVQVYLDAVRAELRPGDLLLIEQRFSLDRLHPPGEMFDAAERTFDPKAALVPGAWCHFWPAAGICSALREEALATARVEFAEAPLSSPPDPGASRPRRWAAAHRRRARRALDSERSAPMRTRSSRRGARSPGGEAGAMGRKPSSSCRRPRLCEDELIARKLESPAQVERLLGSKRKREIADLVLAESHDARAQDRSPPFASVLRGGRIRRPAATVVP
jgi:Protein of unknown function (DUF2800)